MILLTVSYYREEKESVKPCLFREIIYFRKMCRGGSRIPCRRGRRPSRGAPTYNFVKFSEKLHEIEKILGLNPPLMWREKTQIGAMKS